jgi:hypothetical protein
MPVAGTDVHGSAGIRGSAVNHRTTGSVSAPASYALLGEEATPTARWLRATDEYMPPLEGAAGTAERLLLLIHYGIDWSQGWVARYRATYWERLLPDRIICATYRSSSLRRWWRDVADDLGSRPRTTQERQELEQLLRADPLPVLEVLRFETEALLLRTRIVADAVRGGRISLAEESAAEAGGRS